MVWIRDLWPVCVPFVESNAIVLRRLAHEYGVLPHELLHQNLVDFNFDVAVTFFADKKMKEAEGTHGSSPSDVEKNKFATSKGQGQFTQKEFESLFGKAFIK
jgi:hypothetical protein